jgi:exopolyphosphatase/guanosine-5'-triphosphate,3'-diphosphate pyrophosphatase
MKRAVIDIGTNSIRLLVAEMQSGKIMSGKKYVRMVRLGEMVDYAGVIGEAALGRCMKVLKEFVEIAAIEKEGRIKALATSAVRDAKNRNEIVGRIESELPIDVEILSGDEEAEMGYFGVLSSFEAQGVFMMVDIGGGSTEFVIGSRERIYYKKSIDMGAVRMTEQFIKSDPVNPEDSIRLERHIRGIIKSNLSDINIFDKGTLIGIGGTITTLGAIKLKMGKYDREKIHLTSIGKGDIRGIVGELGRLPLEIRKSIIGLDSERADIIYAGSIILQEVLNYFGCNDIVISDCDNLEGYLMTR